MKRILIMVTLLCSFAAFSQSCLPDGITFTSQEDVTDFSTNHPTCTTIEGDVVISGNNSFLGLEQITVIEGGIICDECSSFINFQGLNNLSSVGFIEWDEGGFFNFSGLESLTNVVDFINLDEANFNSLNGLSALQSVGGDVIIQQSDAEFLFGPQQLTSIGGNLIIEECGDLTTIDGLDELTSIGGSLIIQDNNDLESVSGLSQLAEIGGDLNIRDNPELQSLASLELITSLDGQLFIEECNALQNLEGMNNIASINGAISVTANEMLSDISAIAGIDPESISALQIGGNPMLSACSVASVCGFLQISTSFSQIGSNLENCNSAEEVLANCGIISVDEQRGAEFSLLSTVVSNELVITGADKASVFHILNANGQLVLKGTASSRIDVSELAAGMYMIRSLGDQPASIKFIKE